MDRWALKALQVGGNETFTLLPKVVMAARKVRRASIISSSTFEHQLIH